MQRCEASARPRRPHATASPGADPAPRNARREPLGRLALGSGLAALLLAACAPAASSTPTAASAAAPASAPAAAPASAPAAAPASTEPAASAASAPAKDTLASLIEAAKKEGELTVLASLSGSATSVPRWAEGTARAYGITLNVKYTPAPAMPEVVNRLIQERQSGRPSSTDIVIASSEHIVPMLQADALEAVDWASWAPNIQDARLLAPDGVAVEIAARNPGITYNSNRITPDAVPTSLQDLLKPQYKGQVASTPYAAHFDKLASAEIWGEARTADYVTRLADQINGVIRCSELERVASGEFDLFAMDCGAEWRSPRMAGAPLGHVIPSDAALQVYWYVGVPSNAVHPNAAKLFVNYMLGREGQDILFDTEQVDHPLVAGSKGRGELEALQARGIQVTEVDAQFYQRNNPQALEKINADQARVLQKR